MKKRSPVGTYFFLIFSVLIILQSKVEVVHADSLSIGSLSAVSTTSTITLSLSSGISGGSGVGYTYYVYRDGTNPNFTPSAGNLLATVSSFPYIDSTAPFGTQFYKVIGTDSLGATANATPGGLGSVSTSSPLDITAARQINEIYPPALAPNNTKLILVAIGDSITQGYLLDSGAGTCSGESPVSITESVLAAKPNISSVTCVNYGVGGATTGYWLPVGYTGGYDYYINMKWAAQSLMADTPSATPVFSIMLGTNDASAAVSVDTYSANLTTIINQLFSDFPTAKVIVHYPIYFSPNVSDEAALNLLYSSYLPAINTIVASFSSTHLGSVYVGDEYGFGSFAMNYLADFIPQPGSNGTYYLHPTVAGAANLGTYWANSIYSDLFPVSLSTITTGSSSSITRTGATLSGNITATGGANPTSRRINYGLTTSYGLTSASDIGSFSTGTFTESITDLVCGTTYHYQASATNSAGTSTGSDSTFTTAGCPSGGGISLPVIVSALGGLGQPLDFKLTKQIGKIVTLSLNANQNTVKGYIVSTKQDFSDALSIQPYTNTPTFTLPDTNSHTIYLKYYSTTGSWSSVIQHDIDGATVATTGANTSRIVFTRTLKLGSTGADIKALQQFLNRHGFVVAISGVGSPGYETTTFGSKTVLALSKFQKANNIKPASGLLGPITLKFVNQSH